MRAGDSNEPFGERCAIIPVDASVHGAFHGSPFTQSPDSGTQNPKSSKPPNLYRQIEGQFHFVLAVIEPAVGGDTEACGDGGPYV